MFHQFIVLWSPTFYYDIVKLLGVVPVETPLMSVYPQIVIPNLLAQLSLFMLSRYLYSPSSYLIDPRVLTHDLHRIPAAVGASGWRHRWDIMLDYITAHSRSTDPRLFTTGAVRAVVGWCVFVTLAASFMSISFALDDRTNALTSSPTLLVVLSTWANAYYMLSAQLGLLVCFLIMLLHVDAVRAASTELLHPKHLTRPTAEGLIGFVSGGQAIALHAEVVAHLRHFAAAVQWVWLPLLGHTIYTFFTNLLYLSVLTRDTILSHFLQMNWSLYLIEFVYPIVFVLIPAAFLTNVLQRFVLAVNEVRVLRSQGI